MTWLSWIPLLNALLLLIMVGKLQDVLEAVMVSNVRMRQPDTGGANGITRILSRLDDVQSKLDTHLREAQQRAKQAEPEVALQELLRRLTRMGELDGKEFEEISRLSKRLVVAIERRSGEGDLIGPLTEKVVGLVVPRARPTGLVNPFRKDLDSS